MKTGTATIPAQPDPMPLTLERALRRAADWHRDQVRKGSGVPYVQHPMAVAMILDRLDFPEEVVIAGLLHDAVEDTTATIESIRDEFGSEVAEIVEHCSEIKLDRDGQKRPWIDRKRDHLAALATAPATARAVVLADKLHNLQSIRLDLLEGRSVWETFNADQAQVLWYYESSIDLCAQADPRLEVLAGPCRRVLAEVQEAAGLEKSRAGEVAG